LAERTTLEREGKRRKRQKKIGEDKNKSGENRDDKDWEIMQVAGEKTQSRLREE